MGKHAPRRQDALYPLKEPGSEFLLAALSTIVHNCLICHLPLINGCLRDLWGSEEQSNIHTDPHATASGMQDTDWCLRATGTPRLEVPRAPFVWRCGSRRRYAQPGSVRWGALSFLIPRALALQQAPLNSLGTEDAATFALISRSSNKRG